MVRSPGWVRCRLDAGSAIEPASSDNKRMNILGNIGQDPLALAAIGLIAGLLLGGIGLLLMRKTFYEAQRRTDAQQVDLSQQLDEARARISQHISELAQAQTRAALADQQAEELTRLREESAQLREHRGRIEMQLDAERKNTADKLKLLEESREVLVQQFRLLANEILEEKSRRFTEQNQQNIGAILDPLKQRLGDFQSKVEKFYDTEGKERSALSAQVRELFSLNRSLSEDAKNLTQALKGESKTRGNWGELVLERILESIGLQKGREYEVQVSGTVDGDRLQPDVVIHLPDDRHIVVDSKVSLVDWETACSAEDDGERATAMRRHRDSLRNHIKELSAKNYQALYGIHSLDCVVMFVPIEPALLSVVAEESGLFQEAWEKHVLLVSSSTLFFALRTVAYLWRQDAQNRNAQEIASRGAELYDKLNGFVVEMEKLGDHLDRAQRSYTVARNRLADGRGNVIRQAEMLRELGVKPKKLLPDGLREAALDESGDNDRTAIASDSDEQGQSPSALEDSA